MSVSLPSKPVVIADVPEVSDFPRPQFVYNFFTRDESVNETGNVPGSLASKPMSYFEGIRDDIITKRLPRYIRINFGPVILETDPGYVARTPNDAGLISKNLSKIVMETNFSNDGFVGINFEPVSFGSKIYTLVSSSANSYAISPELMAALPGSKLGTAAMKVHEGTSVPPSFLQMAMSRPYIEGYVPRAHVPDPTDGVSVRLLADTRFAASIVASSLFDPLSSYNEDIRTLYELLRPEQVRAISQSKYRILQHSEFDPAVPYLSIEFGAASKTSDSRATRIVGYIIDKWEVYGDGTFRSLDPIVIENPKATTFVDHHVRYGSEYAYAIRAIAEATYSMAVEHEDGTVDIARVKLLVSSRPSQKQYVRTVENVPPPPPCDIDFVWDYETRSMNVMWSFPVNTQRDIKKFQVFRRIDTNSPFELLRVFDFNDSQVVYPDPENDSIRDSRMVRLPPNSPVTFYTDDEFTRDSKFIYAVASVDAHGLSSGYSQQFEVSFDKFKNRLVKRLISPSGAPKAYPNYYLLADAFQDVFTGSYAQTLKVYFSPDGYNLSTGDSRVSMVKKSSEGYYKLLVMNTDLQKQRSVKFFVNDLRDEATKSDST